jgi:EF-hand domain-containing protein 1
MAYQQSQQMKKEFRLPMVPGMSCGEEMMRRNYDRRQIHGARADGSTHVDGVPADRTLGASTRTNNSTLAARAGSYANTTSAIGAASQGNADAREDLTGRVLRFYGYAMEPVTESALETERVRKVVLNFYLEDGTMSVTEPKLDNSGFAFPANLKRHIVPNPDGTPITAMQLKVGESITFYGRTYVLYDADAFTRSLLQEAGEVVPDALPLPNDTYSASRARPATKARGIPSIAASSPLNTTLSAAQVQATQRFLENDRKVLRCDCTWDDTASLYGTKHFLTLYYFLSDGSIALVEKDVQNSGRDPFPTFFSRQRIAKPTDPAGRFDSSTLGSVTFKENANTVYYSDEDIRIGNVLNLYGRAVKIHDYNQFTKDYIAEKFGITEYAPLHGGLPPPFVPPSSTRREISEEEKRAQHTVKHEEMRRHRYANSVVKFFARLDNGKADDTVRRFVLSVYPADNTIAIFEPVIRNSGIVGGKFLQRQKVRRPDGEYFQPDDFYVGARVVLNAYPFVILNSDAHSLDYMERNPEEFSHSDINKVVRKLQAMLRSRTTGLAEAFRLADQNRSGGLDMAVFLSIMDRLKLDVTEQEILTVLRFFDKNNESYVSYEEVAGRILPEGDAVASDDRSWEVIYQESADHETKSFVTDPKEVEEKARQAQENATAASGAAHFMQLYTDRRQLFMKEFRAITDYAKDSLIGADEFRLCVRQKLEITSIPDEELAALTTKLFPTAAPRVTYEEFMRLVKGTSTYPHSLAAIAANQPVKK